MRWSLVTRYPSTLNTMSSSRSYADAIQALNSLQSNASVLADIKSNYASRTPFIIGESIEYLHRAGYTPNDLNRLNVLHIAGTKGKGSTSAFTSSLLTHLSPKAKIGLYTSPHLVAVRERIRINGQPISEELFAKYFWQVWDKYEENQVVRDYGSDQEIIHRWLMISRQRKLEDSTLRPAYFRYLTIMAFHVFLSEKVDATVLEVGIGGLLDTTNLVPVPLATGITPLGLDHTAILGNTIELIASAKAGIYKEGCPALSVSQPEGAQRVVEETAKTAKTSSFSTIPVLPAVQNIKLGLAGAHQQTNASLALALIRDFLSAKTLPSVFEPAQDLLPAIDDAIKGKTDLPAPARKGLENAFWPGRCQIAADPKVASLTWYLDGAHTVDSLQVCADWFGAEKGVKESSRILIFNCTSDRIGKELLEALSARLESILGCSRANLFSHVIFCPNVTYTSGQWKADLAAVAANTDLSVQAGLKQAWIDLLPTGNTASESVHVMDSVESAVRFAQTLNEVGKVSVLACGSLHLVGGVTEVSGI